MVEVSGRAAMAGAMAMAMAMAVVVEVAMVSWWKERASGALVLEPCCIVPAHL